jgi:hypothetical protein
MYHHRRLQTAALANPAAAAAAAAAVLCHVCLQSLAQLVTQQRLMPAGVGWLA